jgi:cytochrome bd ubiquinol oxidase subunit II
MTASSGLIGLPEVVAGLTLVTLNAYLLMGGADFGGGVWDLLASGPRRAAQRELIAGTIAPIWEANHVWLIFVVVLLFTGFPLAFSAVCIVLHIPLALMLVGIVMRGSAFVFRSYGHGDVDRSRWGRAFAVASTITPLLLGIVIGALASGDIGDAWPLAGKAPFHRVFIAPWFAPFPLAVGALGLSLVAFLAAVYLTVEAPDDALREDFRRRALAAAVAVFVTAFGVLAVASVAAPHVLWALTRSPWAIVLQLGTAVAAMVAIVALTRRRFRIARIAVAAQVSCILWGWAGAQYPFLVPSTITIRAAAAPEVTLKLLLIGLAAGLVLLVPALGYLFRTFSAQAKAVRHPGE